ncbi:uncharacterized protein G2W53_012215 [Senna tora]|uniref:Uncharacterized protein n=1 Tax=Senna tora TaxID=362788 RepID=A0A834WPJ7_9FABA|nr:uncharacterized protein G2W53_012215 [Senna tora]
MTKESGEEKLQMGMDEALCLTAMI